MAACLETSRLNAEAWSSIAGVKTRADALETYAPEHYAFHRLRLKIAANH